MLKVTDVAKVLGGKRVLDGVGFELGRGGIAVILGENGAGKSTLLRIVAGLLTPDAGEVVLLGASLARDEIAAKRELGYVPDATDALPDLLVREFIALVWALKRPVGDRAAPPDPALIERLGLTSIWGLTIGALSFGQRKRMCMLAATCGDPWLWVLDEPSNGLDPEGVALVTAMIAERAAAGKATLLSTNDAAFALGVGGTRYRIRQGKLVAEGASASANVAPSTA